jgi:hypothetical protein
MDFRPLSTAERQALHNALRRHVVNGEALLTDPKDTSFAGVADDVTDEEVINAVKSVPTHYVGIGSVSGTSMNTEVKWLAQNTQTGGVYNPVTSPGDIRKTQAHGTGAANNASGGGDEVFSFQQTISAGSSATLDLTAMTNVMQQAGVSIARIKGVQFRLLSQLDDTTIAANASAVVVQNQTPAVPANLFGNGGSGLTLALTTAAGAITGVAIGAAGSGYPRSCTFLVVPQQAGGSGGAVSVITNSSGVPTTVALVAGSGGTGYANATVPAVVAGYQILNGGSASISGGAFLYVDGTAAGFMLVSATGKNITFQNLDAVNAASIEVDIFAATT